MGSVRATSAELEEFFTTEELEDFEDFLDELEELLELDELEELFDFTELDELFVFFELDELLGFAELEDSWTSAELDDVGTFSLEDETLALLEELLISLAELEEDIFLTLDELLPFSKLELVSAISSELEVVSGSIRMTLEESSPQATKKSNEQTGSNW
jgi:hypothetical protein